jgi:hypothetical protein
MPQIHATGTHETFTRAERATITARVSVTAADRALSIADATNLHNLIAARAQQLRDSGDATWHAADAPSTWIHTIHGNDGSNAGVEHVTTSRVRVKLANLSLVGQFVEELSNAGAETEVSWSLTDVTRREREREARKAAVGAAREVAEDYADALGEKIVRVVSISDGVQAPGFGGPRMLAAAAYSAEGAEVSIAEITVSASVAGVFETE